MPLVKFDLIKGRKPEEITQLLEVSHQVFVNELAIPEGDRYQVVNQHEHYEMIMKDTGLGFERTTDVVLMTVFSRERTKQQKEKLYRELVGALAEECGIAPRDVMISFIINTDEDWSFGFGRAQFLTGEL